MRLSTVLLAGWVSLMGIATDVDAAEGSRPNRLIHESSPYLRLHAHNPVDWYPWGQEAFDRARKEDKPIFLSVGYSTCYWCHVMERQVFSDPEIADLMNRWFVNIKVDREERPDIDELYMTTTQLLTGSGGWPNSVFLTPDRKPFFAGTYFPPADQGGRPGFPTILTALHRAWLEKRVQVDAQALQLTNAVAEVLSAPEVGPMSSLPTAAAALAVTNLKKTYDDEWRGFGGAPKFPSPANLFLLWFQGEQGDLAGRAMVIETLEAMGRGAIYDQLGGGFHRYTLDREWRIPHFEKMLYDNALLAEILVVTSGASGNADLERLARGTLEFILRVMRLPNGAFKSAIDAETDGREGAFYVWTRKGLDMALGEDDSQFLAAVLGYDGDPNFEEHHYTLYLEDSIAQLSDQLGVTRGEFLGRLEPLLAKLKVERDQRPFPKIDDKVLTDWNGMAIAAFAAAGRVFSEDRYIRAAVKAAEFVLGQRDQEGIQLHVWRAGQAKQRAFLDDYAFLIHGLLALFRATGEDHWLAEAERLTMEMERQLREPTGAFFNSPEDSSLLVRSTSARGGAIPAGNGVAMVNLLQLAELTGRPIYRARAVSAIQAFAGTFATASAGMPTVALAVEMARRSGPGTPEHPAAEEMVTANLELAAPAGDGDWREFSLGLEVREGWHINANPASLDLLIPTQLEGDLRAVAYPAGRSIHLAFADKEIQVYDGGVSIRGQIAAESEILLIYQACDDRRCLPPIRRRIELPE